MPTSRKMMLPELLRFSIGDRGSGLDGGIGVQGNGNAGVELSGVERDPTMVGAGYVGQFSHQVRWSPWTGRRVHLAVGWNGAQRKEGCDDDKKT